MAGPKWHTDDLVTFPRDEFIADVFDYAEGDHCTFLAPTGGGKTHLQFQLLGATARPELQATVFVMKPKDATVDRFTKEYGFKTIRDWPPPRIPNIVQKRPPGYILWPPETGNPEADDIRHEATFRRALRQLYVQGKKSPSIIDADETYSLENELGLKDDLRRIWTKGRSMGVGLWAGSQRPAFISLWAYQAQHLFLGNDPDAEARKRFSEIGGGLNPEIVREVTGQLRRYQFLYISREDRSMCIVDA